ncbi:MAG: LysR family transcriptional regulator [Lautropia sp.]
MDLRDLRYFVAIAQAGSVRRAAELVHRSQPALTKAVDRLEESLGVKLFERNGRGQRISAAGNLLLAHGVRLLDTAATVQHDILALEHGTAGMVRLGSGPLAAEYLLPSFFSLLLAEAPDVQLQLTVRLNHELLEELRKGTLDVVLGFIPEHDAEFRSSALFSETAVVAASHQHPIFSDGAVSLRKLSRYKWALAQYSSSRIWLNQLFVSSGLPEPVAQIESNSIALIPPFIAHTTLLSFVSRRMLLDNASMLREVPFAATTLVRDYGLTYTPERPVSAAIVKLIELLQKHAKALFVAP